MTRATCCIIWWVLTTHGRGERKKEINLSVVAVGVVILRKWNKIGRTTLREYQKFKIQSVKTSKYSDGQDDETPIIVG